MRAALAVVAVVYLVSAAAVWLLDRPKTLWCFVVMAVIGVVLALGVAVHALVESAVRQAGSPR